MTEPETENYVANLREVRIKHLKHVNKLMDEALNRAWRCLRLWQRIATSATEDRPGEFLGSADIPKMVNSVAQDFHQTWCALNAAKDAQRALTW